MLIGEIDPLRALLLRCHLRRCPKCREQLEQTQAMWTGFREIASEPADENLKQRIAAALPVSSESAYRAKLLEAQQMRKRVVVVCALVLVLAAAGLVAAQLIKGGTGSGSVTINGHKWAFTSTFQGRARVMAPDSRVLATVGPMGRNQAEGIVKLMIDDRYNFCFEGLGKHEVKAPNSGELLGYVDMAVVDQKKVEEESGRHVVSGIRATSEGCEGVDKALGIRWQFRGAGKVTVKNTAGGMTGMASTCPPNAPKVPDLTIQTTRKTINYHGYGTFTVPDASGKTVMILIIEPMQAQGSGRN